MYSRVVACSGGCFSGGMGLFVLEIVHGEPLVLFYLILNTPGDAYDDLRIKSTVAFLTKDLVERGRFDARFQYMYIHM